MSTTKTLKKKTEVKYFNMVQGLQQLRTVLEPQEEQVAKILDKMFMDVKDDQSSLMLKRVMLHIGDISRHHNILRGLNIDSKDGGAQMRVTFRHVLKWWAKKFPDSFKANLEIFAEFTLYENLIYYELRSDRKKGIIYSVEKFFPFEEEVMDLLKSKIIAGDPFTKMLIAKHLPNISTGKNRVTKIKMKAFNASVKSFSFTVPKEASWVKVNGILVDRERGIINVTNGDIVSYPREKQRQTLVKERFLNGWIDRFCDKMSWTRVNYKAFRSTQHTPEQMFSQGLVSKLSQEEAMVFFDRLTSGQRFRVQKMLVTKDLEPKPKWGKMANYYILWEHKQKEFASEAQKLFNEGKDNSEAVKKLKVKSTGMSTYDMLVKILDDSTPQQVVDTTYQAMIEKMPLEVNVFPIIDGSGSMHTRVTMDITRFQIASALLVAFSTRNPVEHMRNSYGWFSRNFHMVGPNKFQEIRSNPYMASRRIELANPVMISPEKTFSENLSIIKNSNPGEISSTNMYAVIDYFVNHLKSGQYHVEDLPNVLLFITDNESNTGKSVEDAVAYANEHGWFPLMIYWGIIENSRMESQMKAGGSMLFVSGFNEGVLTQIMRGIKKGTINPDDEIISIYEDKRYSVLTQ